MNASLPDMIPEAMRSEKARAAYAVGRWDEAIVHLNMLVHEHPNWADLHNMLGVCRQHTQDIKGAEKSLKRALEINNRYTEAALNLSVLYNDVGRYDEARALYRHALAQASHDKNALDPMISAKIANAHGDVARLYEQAHKVAEAIAEYDKALALRPEFADIRASLAALLMQQGDMAAATEQLHKAIDDKPDFLLARMRLGACLVALGRRDAAKEEYRKVLHKDPSHQEARSRIEHLNDTEVRPSDHRALPHA